MEIAEKITLTASILWVVWNILSLRNAVLEGEGIFPASITSTLILIISIFTIQVFHLSPLHLIWLFILSFPLGLLAITTPIGQKIGIGLMVLLSMTGTKDEELISVENNSGVEKKANKRKDAKRRGFGN